ncbi:MAG: hypothetical protein ACQEVA_00510 [Myxococcota bacterium]
MRDTLHADNSLGIFLVIDEETDRARLELQTSDEGPDLSDPDDVIIFFDGDSLDVDVEDPQHARVDLGDASRLEERVQLTIRVQEFFDGWEFGFDEN